MSEKRFYIHYADDNNKQLLDSESDLNIHIDEIGSDEEFIQLCNLLNELSDENNILNRRLDYETRMHKKWKDDCLAILEEQDLNDYVKELQKSKKSGWDSEPNTDYITRVKEGLNVE